MTSNASERIGITDVYVLTRWAESVCKGHFTVRFDPKAMTAYVTSRNEIVIPTPNANMTKRDAIRLRGFCIHETSHPLYQKEAFEIMQRIPLPSGSPLAGIFNLVLDTHAETLRAIEWPGDAKALSEFGAVVGRDVWERHDEYRNKGMEFDDAGKKMAALMVTSVNAEGTWNVGLLIGFQKVFKDFFTDEIMDLASEIEKRFDFTKVVVNDCRSTSCQTLWQLSKDIYEFLFDEDAEKEIERGKEEAKGKGEKTPSEDGEPCKDGDGEEGEGGSGSKPGDEEGKEPKSSAADGDDESDEKSDKASKPKKKIPVKEICRTDHYETPEGGTGSGMGFDYTKYVKRTKYIPVTTDRFRIVRYGKGERV